MNIIVVGCGKVGSRLAYELSGLGHDVAVVDKDPRHFEMLPADFDGFTVSGVPIDQDVLRQAGIESCDALAAMTPDDSTNIMVCQLANELFGVHNVLARIYDPQREDVFSHFGLDTVCPTNMTVAAAISYLTLGQSTQQLTFCSTTVAFSMLPVPQEAIGRDIGYLPGDFEEPLFGVLHADGSIDFGYTCGRALQQDDILIFVTRAD